MKNENHYHSDYTKSNYCPNNSKIPVTFRETKTQELNLI
jgi:hypothetical protein